MYLYLYNSSLLTQSKRSNSDRRSIDEFFAVDIILKIVSEKKLFRSFIFLHVINNVEKLESKFIM